MNEGPRPERKTEITIGILYLLATTSSVVGFSLIQSITGSADYLSITYPRRVQVAFGLLSHLVNDGAVVGIGILLFRVIRKYSEDIAAATLSTRIIEGTILAIGKLGLLLLLTISREYISLGATNGYHLSSLGTLAIKWNAWSFALAMIALGAGGLMFCYLLYRVRLVPRWISVIGIIGYLLLFSRSILNILGYAQGFELFLPVALFELIFPVWLIARGFNPIEAAR